MRKSEFYQALGKILTTYIQLCIHEETNLLNYGAQKRKKLFFIYIHLFTLLILLLGRKHLKEDVNKEKNVGGGFI